VGKHRPDPRSLHGLQVGGGSHGQAHSFTAFGYGMWSRDSKQLGVVAAPFIRIIAGAALTSDFPVQEYGPDGPEGMPLRGALDDRLDFRSGDPEPERPRGWSARRGWLS